MAAGSYSAHIWKEHELLTEAQKIDLLNHLETQHEEAMQYMTDRAHDFYTIAEADARYIRTPLHPSGRSDTGHGCGINAATLDGLTKAQILAGAFPSGAIVMFGSGTIPENFDVMDGTNGTPNMQNYIPKGAGGGDDPGDIVGNNSVTPTAPTFTSENCTLATNQIPRHTHNYIDLVNTLVYIGSIYNRGPVAKGAITRTTLTTEPGGAISITPHNHPGGSITWTGYKDESNNSISGALNIRPACRGVRFLLRR